MAVDEWAQGLGSLTAEQVRRGLDEWEGEWPPSLPEFRSACLGKGRNGWGLDYTPECYRAGTTDRAKTLPGPDTQQHRDEALERIREIRKIIR